MTAVASLVVIAYGDPALLTELLETLGTHPDAGLFARIVVVDNGYPAGGDSRTVAVPASLQPRMHYVQNRQRSYASGVNAGVAATATPLVFVSNNDVHWRPGLTVAPLVEVLTARRNVGVVGPQLEFPDGRWQASDGPFPSVTERVRGLFLWEIARNLIASRRHPRGGEPRRVECVSGAFFGVRREVFDMIGGYDESYPFYGEDTEFSWQARARGLVQLVVPSARLVHIRGATAAPGENTESTTRLHHANIRFVARRQGDDAARAYRTLTRAHAWELVALYEVAQFLRPTPVGARRLTIARLSARALDDLPVDVNAPGDEL